MMMTNDTMMMTNDTSVISYEIDFQVTSENRRVQ